MSDREFEKKVQQKMEGLDLRPSESVWIHVERQVRQRRRRRRAILWLPLLLLLLSAGGYYLVTLNNSYNNPLPEKNDSASGQKPLEEHSGNQAKPSDPLKDFTTGSAKQESAGTSNSRVAQDENTKSVAPPSYKTIDSKLHGPAEARNAQHGKSNQEQNINSDRHNYVVGGKQMKLGNGNTGDRVARSKPANMERSGKKDLQSIADENISNHLNNERDEPDLNASLLPDGGKGQPVPPVEVNRAYASILFAADSGRSVEKPRAKSKSSKWQWGLNGGVGISTIKNGDLFNLAKAEAANLTLPLSYTGGVAIVPPASELSNGVQFTVGGFVQRKITNRFYVSGGLQYSYYSTYLLAGTFVNSSRVISTTVSQNYTVSNYYKNDKTATYKNRYHFVEIPITAKWQLNRSKSLPFYWNIGLTYGYLAATNALLYDGNTGIYYEDKSIHSKNQLAFQTALTLRLFGNRAHPVDIGPSLHYNFSELIRAGSDEKKHLLSGGISAYWYLRK